MGERGWYLTGVAGVFVYVVAQVVAGFPPEPGAEVDDVVQHLLVARVHLVPSAAIGMVAAALLLVFATRLRAALEPSPWGMATLVGWVALLLVIIVGQIPLVAISWWGGAHTDGLDSGQDVVRLAFDLNNLALYALSAPFAALSILGPTVAGWRTKLLPRWLVAVGLLEIALNVVELAGVGSSAGWNAAGYAFGLGPIVWLVFVAGTSIVLYRRTGVFAPAATHQVSPERTNT